MSKVILDACCGPKMFWFDKHNQNVEFVDIREMDTQVIWTSRDGKEERRCSVEPTTIADFTKLPFPDNSFYHVVFDPPHLTRLGETSWLAKKYGILPADPAEWQPLIKSGFDECMRVLKPYGTLIFKWSEIDIKVSAILNLIGETPMYGHRSGKQSTTHWLAFMKLPKDGID